MKRAKEGKQSKSNERGGCFLFGQGICIFFFGQSQGICIEIGRSPRPKPDQNTTQTGLRMEVTTNYMTKIDQKKNYMTKKKSLAKHVFGVSVY